MLECWNNAGLLICFSSIIPQFLPITIGIHPSIIQCPMGAIQSHLLRGWIFTLISWYILHSVVVELFLHILHKCNILLAQNHHHYYVLCSGQVIYYSVCLSSGHCLPALFCYLLFYGYYLVQHLPCPNPPARFIMFFE